MRRTTLALVLLVTLSGCAGKAPPQLSPAGSAAFYSTQAVHALDVLRDFATAGAAQSPPLISKANTLKVVNFHEAAVKTINAVPGGWRPTVSAALAQLEHDILPAEWARLLPYVALIKSLIDAVPS